MSRFRIFKWNEALGFRIEESREMLPQEARTNPLPSVIRCVTSHRSIIASELPHPLVPNRSTAEQFPTGRQPFQPIGRERHRRVCADAIRRDVAIA